MSVELSVNLDKNGVYFAGETLSCELTFRYAYQSVVSPVSTTMQPDAQSQADTVTPATSVATSPAPSIRESWASSRYSLDDAPSGKHGRTAEAPSHKTHASEGSIGGASTRTFSRPTRLRSIAASMSTPSTQLLWGFAQIVGVFTIDDVLIRSDAFASLNTRGMYQAIGVNGMVGGFGGGTLGITSPAMGSRQSSDGRATDNKVKLPLFTTPPSIFFTDLTLHAGQEKTYQFELKLPSALPR
ncbi:Rgp1-domain-containing protein [Syncephalis pseudoplumigaleata]|uniref:Rgp1-domain-containing protein n=1 Tax=Syncephalis pseudoplumigaleata TaxID=1712513 RepID=A0A4P9YT32_9FUNG|nr:Rgp1-domain-containing protein [Syncephalis pseudoplumigaleata]|eukprot:RKP22562.1 Rgp1-domain-containing protein [Syncephalis pseudoplumigaleata]